MKNVKEITKKVISLLLVLTMLISLAVVGNTTPVYAANTPSMGSNNRTLFYSKNGIYGQQVWDIGNGKATNWKSSNSKVLKITDKQDNCVWFKTLKTGKATISCVVKVGKKKYKLSTTYIVKKADPLQYVKVNGKNVYKKNYYLSTMKKKAGESVKVEWKLKKGWKVLSANYRVDNGKGATWKKMKNKKSFKVGKVNSYVSLELVNEKNEIYHFNLQIEGKKK